MTTIALSGTEPITTSIILKFSLILESTLIGFESYITIIAFTVFIKQHTDRSCIFNIAVRHNY